MIPKRLSGRESSTGQCKNAGRWPSKTTLPTRTFSKKNGNFVLQHSGFDVGNGEILTNVRCGDDLMLHEKHCDECIFYDGKIH